MEMALSVFHCNISKEMFLFKNSVEFYKYIDYGEYKKYGENKIFETFY